MRPSRVKNCLSLDREIRRPTQFTYAQRSREFHQNVVDFFFLGSYSNQGTFLFLLNSFVYARRGRSRLQRERERDLFFLRAQFLRVVASPPSFLSKFLPTANKLEKKKPDDDDKRGR